MNERMRIEAIRRTAVFGALSPGFLKTLLHCFERMELAGGETLHEKGRCFVAGGRGDSRHPAATARWRHGPRRRRRDEQSADGRDWGTATEQSNSSSSVEPNIAE
jgi:hypothetical protein